MGLNVTAHTVQQYGTNVALLLQQKGSKLRDTVTIGSHVGKAAVPARTAQQRSASNRARQASRRATPGIEARPTRTT